MCDTYFVVYISKIHKREGKRANEGSNTENTDIRKPG